MNPKNLTKIADLTRQDVESIISRAFRFKEHHDSGVRSENLLNGKVVALVFEKPSLRTKVAFEVATTFLGGNPVFLSSSQILASGQNQHGRESIPDIGRNLERFVDLIIARVYYHDTLNTLASSISIPVINALCDKHHPSQALADLMAIRWHKKDKKDLRVAFIGDGNNVATSLLQLCALVGIHTAIATPTGYELPIEELRIAQQFAAESGVEITTTNSPQFAIENADIIYTDTFVSMGQEAETKKRLAEFDGFRVDSVLMKHASPEALFMHCLPAHRGEEVTDEVMDAPYSIVFDQAECRLHIAKALIAHALE